MSNIEIRTATESDAERLLEIYAYYVENTAITFEYEVPSPDEFRDRIRNTLEKYPYICILRDGNILGYAYAGILKDREAYKWSAETAVYVDRNEVKTGLGKILYAELERRLKDSGFKNMYACIAYPSEEDEYLTKNSALFHEHMGFVKVGEFHSCGYKFGRWYDMIYMEKMIGNHDSEPASPVKLR